MDDSPPVETLSRSSEQLAVSFTMVSSLWSALGGPDHPANEQIIRDKWDAINAHKDDPKLDGFVALLGEDHEWVSSTRPDTFLEPVRGREAGRQFMLSYIEAFPNLRLVIKRMVSHGDYVFVEWLAKGNHQSYFMGVEPTNNYAEVSGCTRHTLKDAQVVSTVDYWDMSSLLQQISPNLDLQPEESHTDSSSLTGSGQTISHPSRVVSPPGTEGGVKMLQAQPSRRETIKTKAREYSQNLSKEVQDLEALTDLRRQYYGALVEYQRDAYTVGNGYSKQAAGALSYFAVSVGLPVLEGAEAPERLVTVQEGVELTGVPHGTVGRWLSVGRIPERGRLWFSREGGRSIPLISLADLAYLAEHRPPVGKNLQKRKRRRASTKTDI